MEKTNKKILTTNRKKCIHSYLHLPKSFEEMFSQGMQSIFKFVPTISSEHINASQTQSQRNKNIFLYFILYSK